MNRTQSKRARRQRERKLSGILMAAFVAVLFVGLFAQVAMVARLSQQAKAIQKVDDEVSDLSNYKANLDLALKQFQSPERVTTRALELGMVEAGPERVRVVHLTGILADTSAQSAESIGTEEIQ